MGDNMNDDMVMDLDLNQEPFVDIQPPPPPPFEYGPLLNELETSHSRIEDRIRQLEAVSARARQRQRWRQARNNPELSYMRVIGSGVDAGNTNQENNGVGIVNPGGGVEESGERGRNSKRDVSQLAKALEMDLDSKKKDENGGGGDEDDDGSGGFFDCNICLEMARDPILTCCGHLFCWCCFYQLSYVDSSAKECPVCKGEVTDSSITPIYGNGKSEPVLKLESGVKIPPRPQARRVESIRQQRVIRGVSHIPVAEALRRIRIGIGSIGENRIQGLDSVLSGSETNPSLLHNLEVGGSGSRRQRSRQFSRVLSESAASLSSISSALNNAERLVEDLETYISDRLLRRTDAQILPNDQEMNAVFGHAAEVQPEPQNAEMSLSLPLSTSSQRSVAATVVQLDNLSTDSAVEIDLTISQSHPSSTSRRTNVSRTLSLEGGTSRELRRRRLR